MNRDLKFEISNLKFKRCRFLGVIMVISGLMLPLLVCHSGHAAGMNLQITPPDAKLMLPSVSPLQVRQEGLPLSFENSIAKDFIGFLERGEYKEALAYFREKENTGNGFSSLDFAELGDPSGELKKRAAAGGGVQVVGAVRGFLQDLNKMGQVSAYMLYLIGNTYFSLEKYPAAEAAFSAALVPLPDYTRVHESLGYLYLRMERYKEAHEHLGRAAGLGLNSAELFGALGYLHYQTLNYWSAADAFQKALMLAPDNPKWKRGLLQSLSRTYRYKDTLALVEQLLLEEPDDAGIWLFRAKAALGAGEREKALSSLETAIRMGDDNRSNLMACAILHMELGSIERAIALMKSGISDGMDFVRVEQMLAWLEQTEKWDLLKQMTGAVRDRWDDLSGPQRGKILTREAAVSFHKGDLPVAGDSLEKAIAVDPSNADALILLADIHRKKKNYDRAELLYRRAGAYEQYRENALISLAQLASDQDDFEGALRILLDMRQEFPDRTDLNRNIEYLKDLVLLESDGA